MLIYTTYSDRQTRLIKKKWKAIEKSCFDFRALKTKTEPSLKFRFIICKHESKPFVKIYTYYINSFVLLFIKKKKVLSSKIVFMLKLN